MTPRRVRSAFLFMEKNVVNRLVRLGLDSGLAPDALALLETTGRRSGLPRRTPVGGRLVDGSFWLVSNHGRYAQYVRNIMADPQVRVQLRGEWRTGTARLLPDDDPWRRLGKLPAHNSAMVRMLGTELLTIRIDFDRR